MRLELDVFPPPAGLTVIVRLLLAFLLVSAGPALAAEPESLTLSEAWAVAGRQQREWRAAQAERRGAEAGIQQASAGQWPFLAARLDGASDLTTSRLGPALELTYVPDTSGERAARVQLASHQAALVGWDVAQLSQRLRQQVADAYYDVQEAEALADIARLAVTGAEANLKDAQALRQAGVVSRFEVQRAQVELAQAKGERVEAERRKTVTRLTLGRLLGLPPGAEVRAAEPVAERPDWQPSLQASLDHSLATRPELKRQAALAELAEAQARLGWAARHLQTELFVTGDTIGLGPSLWPPNTATSPSSSLSPWNPGLTAGARLRWLLADGGAAAATATQAEASATAAALRREDATLLIRLEVEQAFAALTASRANIALRTEALSVAREGLASARERFKGGVGTQTDVLLAQEDLIRAEGDRVRAILGFNRAIAELERVALALGLPEPSPAGR